jgi:glyceraldehyde-3-phosphate dehydrogenase (NADP+)
VHVRRALTAAAQDCAIILEDADIALAAKQCASGAFSFNGQRCTAIKLVWVPASRAAEFVPKFVDAVDALKIGMPWDEDAKITPLCEDGKPEGIRDFIEDALKVRTARARCESECGG